MSLIDEAKANPDTPLTDLDPFIEADLFVIIKAYEEALRNSETEEGAIISNYGEVSKNQGGLGLFKGLMNQYSGSSESINQSSALPDISENKSSPFTDCFPCDLRLNFKMGNLPHPGTLSLFSNFLDIIEAFIQQMKDLMDPTAFYSKICDLLNGLRFVCPQDLLILLALLKFQLSWYISLSFEIDLDWIAILGLLLLPILLLIQSLLQQAVNIGLGPLRCLIDFLLTFRLQLHAAQSSNTLEALGITSDTGALKGTSDSVLKYNPSAAPGDDFVQPLDDPNNTSNLTPSTTGVSVSSGGGIGTSINVSPEDLVLPLEGLLAEKYRSILTKIPSLDMMLITATDIGITLEQLLGRWTRALQVIIDLLSRGITVRMQYMAAIVQIIRLIAFITALINALKNSSVCSDPTKPLSSTDIQAIIQALNVGTTTDQVVSSTATSPAASVSSTVGVDFNTSTGELIVQNKITNQSTSVPTCISGISADDRDKILEWVQSLESSSV